MTRGAALGALGLVPSVLKRLLLAGPAPRLARSTFEPLVGEVFGVNFGAGLERLVLTQVKALSPGRSAQDEERFALWFRAPMGQRRPDGIRVVQHPRIANTSMFLSSVDRAAKGLSYEAIFYRA
jgi:hypothetical protein